MHMHILKDVNQLVSLSFIGNEVSKIMYEFLNIFFLAFHAIIILFNLFGWIWKPFRKANLITLALTGGSWTFLGIFYGWGYCPITDWHYNVLTKLGKSELPTSYIQYLLEQFFDLYPSQSATDTWTLILFLVALSLSLLFNLKEKLNFLSGNN